MNLDGDKILGVSNFISKTFDIIVEYRISGEADMKYHKIGKIMITAVKDYLWGVEKNQKIYANREAIAEILDRNAKFFGKDKDFFFFILN